MNQLYILRHGIAVPHGSPDYLDEDRPLTAEGKRRLREIGKKLRGLDLKLDKIVTSPLPRARETAEIVAHALGHAKLIEEADALRADRSAVSIRDWVLGRPELNLMIVGHNPSLSDLLGLLVAGEHAEKLVELRKGGLAALTARPQSGFQIDWIATPRLIRKL